MGNIDTERYEFDATDKVHSHSWVTKNVVKCGRSSNLYRSRKYKVETIVLPVMQ